MTDHIIFICRHLEICTQATQFKNIFVLYLKVIAFHISHNLFNLDP